MCEKQDKGCYWGGLNRKGGAKQKRAVKKEDTGSKAKTVPAKRKRGKVDEDKDEDDEVEEIDEFEPTPRAKRAFVGKPPTSQAKFEAAERRNAKGKGRQIDVEDMLDEAVTDREARKAALAFELKMIVARREILGIQEMALREELLDYA